MRNGVSEAQRMQLLCLVWIKPAILQNGIDGKQLAINLIIGSSLTLLEMVSHQFLNCSR